MSKFPDATRREISETSAQFDDCHELTTAIERGADRRQPPSR
jgi:hypothetical protein